METEKYISYLLSGPKGSSCVRSSEVLEVSHDEVNSFLLSDNFSDKNLFDKASLHLDLFMGTLSVDDSFLDKMYSYLDKNDLVSYFYSGKHHKTVKGVNLITLLYTDSKGISLHVNFRIYDKKDNKTKNQYFRDMVYEVIQWGLQPGVVTGDCWYSSVENFKFMRKHELSFLFAIESNRIISSVKGVYQNVSNVEIPEDGLYTHLKEFGFVKIFRMVTEQSRSTVDKKSDTSTLRLTLSATQLSDHVRYYAYYHTERTLGINRKEFEKSHHEHWKIEIFHRISKQSCNLEDFFVRKASSVKTHIFCALRAFIRLSALVKDNLVDTHYSLQKQIFLSAQKNFIYNFS